MFTGLRTIIYPAPDLAASRTWYTSVLGIDPYFNEEFYVGFNVAGYELGLDPHADSADGPTTYWGVADADVALAGLLAVGATPHGEVRDVGDGIRVATIIEPGGAVLGIIENPHFHLEARPSPTTGPGR